MKKRLIIFFLVSAFVFSALELYVVNYYSQDISLTGFFSSILSSVAGTGQNKLIRINLYNYSIALYQDGALIKQAKIAGAGNPKISPTPVGNFKVLAKEKRHVVWSTRIVMPYSLRFYNGYYIHDIPLTLSGQLISTQYSAGCVRLDSNLAPEVFDWAEIGTRVEIYKAQLVKTAEAPMVYLLTKDGLCQPIASPEVFQAQGFHWQDVAVIPAAEILGYPQGSLIE